MDMPDVPNQLYSALVLAKAKPYSTITSIDKAEALVRFKITDNSIISIIPLETPWCSSIFRQKRHPR